jgi:hypothetical protein
MCLLSATTVDRRRKAGKRHYHCQFPLSSQAHGFAHRLLPFSSTPRWPSRAPPPARTAQPSVDFRPHRRTTKTMPGRCESSHSCPGRSGQRTPAARCAWRGRAPAWLEHQVSWLGRSRGPVRPAPLTTYDFGPRIKIWILSFSQFSELF